MKKIITLIFCLVVVFLMSACGSNSRSKTPEESFDYMFAGDGVKITGFNGNGVNNMKNISIPDKIKGVEVVEISKGAFQNCPFETIDIPESVVRIGKMAFYGCELLTSITIPDSVTKIDYGAFKNCTSLVSFAIPYGVERVEEYAFYGCTGLTSITIPDSVKSIEEYAFYGCTGIESNIVLQGASETIGLTGCTFYGCTGLTSITIPDSVKSIGKHAFSGCTGLTSITYKEKEYSKYDDFFESFEESDKNN